MRLPVRRMCVNLSARQLREPSLAASVACVLESTGLAPGDLELEITEGIIEDADQASRVLHGLSTLGVHLAIDDFGIGYSSLAHLKRFPINTLKIDRSFVRDVVNSPDDAAITRAVIALGQSLNLRIVAEGVETAEQLAFLAEECCTEYQGFLFGKATSADELARLVTTGPPGAKPRPPQAEALHHHRPAAQMRSPSASDVENGPA